MDAAGARRRVPEGLRDSKLVTEKRRPDVAARATAWVQASSVGWASAAEVDQVGIMRALGLAASRAVQSVLDQGVAADGALVLLDGNHDYLSAVHPTPLTVRPVIKADRDCASVSAASVIAKVARDTYMAELHDGHPAYQWNRNKGLREPGAPGCDPGARAVSAPPCILGHRGCADPVLSCGASWSRRRL